jgi:hypothetical protein
MSAMPQQVLAVCEKAETMQNTMNPTIDLKCKKQHLASARPKSITKTLGTLDVNHVPNIPCL